MPTEYLKMIITMTTDCLMGGISRETYVANMEVVLEQLKEMKDDFLKK